MDEYQRLKSFSQNLRNTYERDLISLTYHIQNSLVKFRGHKNSSANKVMKLLTIKEVCSRLSISRSMLYELIRSNKIRTIRIGKRGIRLPESEIERFIDERLDVSKGYDYGE